MQTPKDHVHAYQFMVDRMSAALVQGDCGALEIPGKRARLGLIIGGGIALLVTIGLLVFGLIVPGGNTVWQEPGAIMLEEESGTRYVLVDGVLRPTRNEASALLRQGDKAEMHTISRASLDGLPRGGPLGIDGAPDTMPSGLRGGSVLQCLPPLGSRRSGMTVAVAAEVPSTPMPADSGLYVRAGGSTHLVWQGRKLRVADPASAAALGVVAESVPDVPPSWLRQLPDGPRIGPAKIPGAGRQGPDVGGSGHPVGTLFTQPVGTGRAQWFVLRSDGLAPLTETEFALLAARAEKPPVELSARDVVRAKRSADTSLLHRLPDLLKLPAAGRQGQSACLRMDQNGAFDEVVLARGIGRAPGAGVTVQLGPGSGLLVVERVRAEPFDPPRKFLITDQGVKYPIADDEALRALRLSGAPITPMTPELLSGVPSGPTLSRAAVGITQKG